MTHLDINCQQFADRLQQCLDERRGVSSDESLVAHARKCSSCDRDLMSWQEVESALVQRSTSPAKRSPSRRLSPRWSVAVAMLLVVTVGTYSRIRGSGANVGDGEADAKQIALAAKDAATSSHSFSDQRLLAHVDPVLWWQDVRSKDWVGHTMPAVESVQAGVAPLGRTLMRAVTILTTGGTGDPSQGQTS